MKTREEKIEPLPFELLKDPDPQIRERAIHLLGDLAADDPRMKTYTVAELDRADSCERTVNGKQNRRLISSISL